MPESEIILGDCRAVIPTIPDGIAAVVTDPPYGVQFRSRRATTPTGKKFVQDIKDDDNVEGAIESFTEVMKLLIPKMLDTSELYVFTRWDIIDRWMEALRQFEPDGFKYNMMLVWDKGIPGMGDIDGNWGCGHEIIMYCKRGRRGAPYKRSSIIHVDKPHPNKIIHPMEKPVALIEELIKFSTDPGDLVVDPWSGSGSTIKAASNLGRRGIGIEVEPHFVERSRERLAEAAMF